MADENDSENNEFETIGSIDIKGEVAYRAVETHSGRIFAITSDLDAEKEEIDDAIEFALDLREQDGEDWNPPLPPSDATVWRYLNFTQLLSILERSQIWFTNVNQFDDPYEGTLPQMNLQSEVDKIVDEVGIDRDDAISIHRNVLRPDSPAAGRGFVNCWNVSEHQSAALWEQYVDSPQGVALRTSVDNLRTALSSADRELVLGKVVYIDYDSDSISRGDLPTIYHKRKSFEHEEEFRVSYLASNEDDLGAGFYADVDIDTLLEQIVISPIAPDWFIELVDRVLDRYDVDCQLKRSELYSTPDVSIE